MGNEGGIETMEPFAAAVPPWRLGVRGVGVQPRRGDVCNFAMELLPDLVTRSTSEDSQPHFESFGRVVHFCGRIILERPEVFVLDIGLPVMLSSFGIPNGLANRSDPAAKLLEATECATCPTFEEKADSSRDPPSCE